MKIKLFLAAVIMAIAMTACTSDEVVMTPETAGTPISFQAVTNNMTRADKSYDSNTRPEYFKVWAFMCSNTKSPYEGTVENYFQPTWTPYNPLINKTDNWQTQQDRIYGDEVDYKVPDGSPEGTAKQWIPRQTRYWPKYDPLRFFAFAGKDDVSIQIGYKDQYSYFNVIFDYTVSEYVATSGSSYIGQADLLYAVSNQDSDGNYYGVKPGANGSVSLGFKHLLSQICFEAENLDTSSDYELTQIYLKNVKGSGTCTIEDILSSAGNPSWSTNENIYNYYVNTYNQENGTYIKLGKTNSGSDVTHKNISNPNYKFPTQNNNYENNEGKDVYVGRAMNLIPQTVNEVYKEGSYDRDDEKSPYIQVYFKVNGGDEQNHKIYLNEVKWEIGKRYIYKLIFSAGDKITYDVSVDDFADETSSDQTIK